jgi:hypothetical protein
MKRITGTLDRYVAVGYPITVTDRVANTTLTADRKKIEVFGWGDVAMALAEAAGQTVQLDGLWVKRGQAWLFRVETVSVVRRIDPATVDVSRYFQPCGRGAA